MKSLYLALLLSFTTLIPASARAATASMQLTPEAGSVETNFELIVQISDYANEAISKPEFDASRLFELQYLGQGLKTSRLNGSQNTTLTLSYLVRPKHGLKPGKYRLPDARITIGEEARELKGLFLSITASRGPSAQTNKNKDIAFIQAVSNFQPYVGEQITYRAEVAADARFQGGSLEDFELTDFWRERITTDKPVTRIAGSTTIHSFVEVLIPTKAGEIRIPERSLSARMATRTRGRQRRGFGNNPLFSDFFGTRSRTRQVVLEADELRLQVKPIPPPPAGVTQSYIPVGTLRMQTSIDRSEVQLGESIVYTIALEGTANLRPLDLAEEETDAYKRYDEEAVLSTRIDRDRLLFKKVFSTALIPTKAGRFTLPRFAVHYFDPQNKEYKTVQAPERNIEVTGGADESLARKGAPSMPAKARPIEKERNEVQILAQDIRPQRLAQGADRAPLRVPKWLTLGILLLAPLLGLSSYYYQRRKQRRAEDLPALRFNNALSLAEANLASFDATAVDDSSRGLDDIRSCLTRYLSSRLGFEAETLTSAELRKRMSEEGIEKGTANDILNFLEALDTARYSGQKKHDVSGFMKELKPLLTALNEATKDRGPR